MAGYKVEVYFDDRTANQEQRKNYFKALDFYEALGVGHAKTGTSTIFFNDQKDLGTLVKALGDIKVLSVSLL